MPSPDARRLSPVARVVVTGAAGFIGSQLLKALVAQHATSDLLAVDHPLNDSRSRNLEVAPGVPFLDHHQFLAALESGILRPSLIFHLGACSSTTETNWDYLTDNNLRYSQRLWNWCGQNGARYIYASSAATYGDGENGFDDAVPLECLRPLNLYGKSKHDFDLWVQAQNAAGCLGPRQCVGFKFFNVFGPGEAHKGRMASMVFHAYHQIRSEGRVKLFRSYREGYQDGGQLRDFIYVKDVVRVMLSFAERPEVSGLFNLGTGQALSFRELIEATYAAMDLEPRIEYIPMPEDLRGKYQYFTQATMTRTLSTGISFTPTALSDAVADYLATLNDGFRPLGS
jgi:ADP-L-glycero-D-manno-heptose 6-epimerase